MCFDSFACFQTESVSLNTKQIINQEVFQCMLISKQPNPTPQSKHFAIPKYLLVPFLYAIMLVHGAGWICCLKTQIP
jgi:hypothetical protein